MSEAKTVAQPWSRSTRTMAPSPQHGSHTARWDTGWRRSSAAVTSGGVGYRSRSWRGRCVVRAPPAIIAPSPTALVASMAVSVAEREPLGPYLRCYTTLI